VSCNDRIEIDDFSYIGTRVVIKQGTRDQPLCIGKAAVVRMGAVVLRDVGDGEVVVGNPARVLRKSKG
jgi:acetyltransferase-like isoleucine patch superfamily enzyme